MQRKRIVYIGNKLARKGGTVTSIETLGSFLQKEGYEVITSSSMQNKVLRLLDMLYTVLKSRKSASVVLIDTYSTQNFYFAVSVSNLCRLLKIPYVPILRGGNLPERIHRSKRLAQRLFGGAMTNVAPSMFLMEHFKEAGYTNLTYIPNTIEIEKYTCKVRKDLNPKLLWVRSFAALYNPDLAVDIVAQCKALGMDVSLCMVGPEKDGSLARCKKEANERQLNVRFTGKLEKEAWIAMSSEYDIFINTTNFDNTPISVIEAMALGIPVISTNVGGLPYLIEHNKNGILVAPNDPVLFVQAITTLLEGETKAQNLAKNARSTVENFAWQKVKHKWFALLNE